VKLIGNLYLSKLDIDGKLTFITRVEFTGAYVSAVGKV